VEENHQNAIRLSVSVAVGVVGARASRSAGVVGARASRSAGVAVRGRRRRWYCASPPLSVL